MECILEGDNSQAEFYSVAVTPTTINKPTRAPDDTHGKNTRYYHLKNPVEVTAGLISGA